jgi:tetratricopeptide (TPR) repeat protein
MLLLAATLIVLLFNLPRVVVDNAEGNMGGEASAKSMDPETSEEFLHNQEISPEDSEKMSSLKASIQKEENQEKTSIFADSLAELFMFYRKYDSAATYFERAAKLDPREARWEKAGNAYYEAFTYAIDADAANLYGQKTRECFNPLIDNDPMRLDLKTKVGMTLVSSQNPMQGITMLREVLESDPRNEEALYNLGILAFQTGQYPTAIERFENLVKVNENNTQGHFYLGVCYKEIGDFEMAKEQFRIVKEMDKSPEVQATVDSYLEEMN